MLFRSFPISLLPWALGFAGAIYGATAVLCGAAFIALALKLVGSNEADRRPAHRLFAFSILYLFLLFAALCAGNGGGHWSLMVSAHPTTATVASVDALLCVTRGSNRPEGA